MELQHPNIDEKGRLTELGAKALEAQDSLGLIESHLLRQYQRRQLAAKHGAWINGTR